ncbi:DUF3813 domain-containing protein [Fictibacillus sp. WQ 8-8]|uniref:DUF3813 domain-containing protein n=1 Tax=Fictibacillus sp. WQ 8-8 TaxID=2938788 RepID=UPI0021099741|nr:DUF3813 domain-containing protein [Fictibacillus sp. WQ 8-8]MCQ6265503.1 DUF3813 domain-containing protein [Fictibacillus sp. WQ 8-8]
MGNNIFQRAREAVSNLVGKNEEGQHEQNEQISQQNNDFSNEDVSVAQNIISSAMADSSDAERQQLAELQEELDQTKSSTQDQQ